VFSDHKGSFRAEPNKILPINVENWMITAGIAVSAGGMLRIMHIV